MQQEQFYQPQWVREDFVDFIAEKINPLWAWKKVKAAVISIENIGTDFYQIQLRPNSNFKANLLQAGQSVLVTVTIGGSRYQRHYSVLKQHCNGDLSIAVKRQGRVSKALTNWHIQKLLSFHKHKVSLYSIIRQKQLY